MSEPNPRESELVLGGEAGKKRQLANELGLSGQLAYEVT